MSDKETKQEKKRYWLKLEKNFLQNKYIKVIKDYPNGKEYILFYLALMLESIDSVGHLRFTDLVPYNEQMLSALTDTNIDIVRSAMNIFQQLGMITILEDGTIFMPEVPKLTGRESESAERVRQFREREKQKALQCNDDVTNSNDNKEKEKDKQEYKQKEYIPFPEIIDYLNQKANTNYRHSSNKTKDLITARTNEGFTLADFKTVIDKKTKEWRGTDFEQYLRPVTLFGTKFESYLNQKISRKDDKPISNEIKHKSIIEGIDYDS